MSRGLAAALNKKFKNLWLPNHRGKNTPVHSCSGEADRLPFGECVSPCALSFPIRNGLPSLPASNGTTV